MNAWFSIFQINDIDTSILPMCVEARRGWETLLADFANVRLLARVGSEVPFQKAWSYFRNGKAMNIMNV